MTELPDGWANERFGDVLTVRYGKALEKSLRLEEGPVPVVGSAGTMTATTKPLVETPCIVIGRKGNVGEARLYADGCWPIDTTYFVQIPEAFVGRYLEVELESLDLRSLDSSTTTPSLRRQDLDEVRLPRPPLREQREIVRILDTQLARLDTVMGAVQAVRDKADQFRRSLLHAAFTGQLTQPDPRRMTDLPDGWRRDEVQELVLEIKPGFASGKHNKTNDGIPHLRPMNVSRAGRIDLADVKYVVDDSDRRLQVGDVLFNNTNSPDLVGKTALVEVDGEFAFSNHMTRLRAKSDVMLPKYLAYRLHGNWLNGYFKSICSNHVNQASIAGKRLSVVEIEVPSITEQEEIVRILDTQLARLDKTLEVADGVAIECGRLRRSLLQAAFTGELTRKWREANG